MNRSPANIVTEILRDRHFRFLLIKIIMDGALTLVLLAVTSVMHRLVFFVPIDSSGLRAVLRHLFDFMNFFMIAFVVILIAYDVVRSVLTSEHSGNGERNLHRREEA